MLDRKKMNSKGQWSKKREFAGIRIKDTGRDFLKKKGTRLRQITMGWDCSVLCLLHNGPRIYNGPI